MDFELSEELTLMRDSVRRMTRERIAPRAAEIDASESYPEDVFQLFSRHDLLGLTIPEGYGGSGTGTLALCLAIETVASVCGNSALILLLSRLPSAPILFAGNEEQKRHFLPRVAEGIYRGAFALTEPHAGSDAANIQTRARRNGSDYLLTGRKSFITGATVADFVIIFARTGTEGTYKDISAFIVRTDSPGFSIGTVEKKLGMEGVPTAEIVLEECRVPADLRLGEEGSGFNTALTTLSVVRPLVGARGLGLAVGALRYATDYTKQREAFGQPIASFQGLRFMMAEMCLKIEAARLLVYQAAWLVDEGMYTRQYASSLSLAKWAATDAAVAVASDAVQLLGASGVMRDYPLERFYRDAKQLQIVEGTNQIHRLIVADALLDQELYWNH